MKFPPNIRPVPARKQATPLVVPLVDLLPSQNNGPRESWLPSASPPPAAPPAAPAIDPEIEARKQAEAAEARRAAEEAGLRQAKERVEAVVERYLDAIARLDQVIRDHRPSPVEVVDLALVVAREILQHEATVDREVVVRAVEEALSQVRDLDAVTVRVGPADFRYIERKRADLVDAGIRFVEDPTLAVGGCIVETPLEVRDASLEARLEAAREGLVELFRHAHETLGEVPHPEEVEVPEENS